MRRNFFPPTSHAASCPEADTVGGPLVIAATARERYWETWRHCHRRGQLTLATTGLIILHLRNEIRVIPPGHAIWIPPDHPHSVHCYGHSGQLGLYLDEPACERLAGYPAIFPTSPLLREAAVRAATWGEHGDTLDPHHQRVVAMLNDEICTSGVFSIKTFMLTMPRDRRLRRVIRGLIECPMGDLDLNAWSCVAGTNARTLSRRFITHTGYTFVEWRQRARILRSIELLTTDMPIAEIARQLGYSSASAYGSVFREILGETPATFRRRVSNCPLESARATRENGQQVVAS